MLNQTGLTAEQFGQPVNPLLAEFPRFSQ
jgi:hypothetical protein